MKVLITGATGQLGYALEREKPASINDNELTVIALGRSQCNLEFSDHIVAALNLHKPDAVINAAAYTAVDKAESDAEKAKVINADAVRTIAQWCQAHAIPLVHVSTDFVFDGAKSTPYLPNDETNPAGVYGATKRDGEVAALSECDLTYVVRTGWVYGEHGANFVKTILRLAAEREQLNIIADQVGTPTYARNLASMIWRLLELRPEQKIFHFSDAGVASWYDFAVAIVESGCAKGLLHKLPLINPIETKDYPTPATRPSYSVLSKTATWQLLDIKPVHWRAALNSMLLALQDINQK